MERDRVLDTALAGDGRPRLRGIAPAVDVEPDAKLRPGRPQRRDRLDDDVDLVRRRERARVRDPDGAVLGERPAVETAAGRTGRARGCSTTTPTLSPGTPSRISRSAIAWLTVTTRRRERDRDPLLQQQQAVDDRVRGAREARPEELRHRLVEVEQDRDADEPERQRRRTRGSPAACGPGRARSAAGGCAPGQRPTTPGRGTRGTRAGTSRGPAPWWRWTSRRWTVHAVEDAVRLRRHRAAGRRRRPGGPPRRATLPRGGRADPPRSRRGRASATGRRPAAAFDVVLSRRSSRRRGGAPGAAGRRGRAELLTVSTTRSARA